MTDEIETTPTEVALPKIKPRVIKVRQFIDRDQLRADLSYSLIDITGAQQQQASLYSHYADLAAAASRQVDDLKLALDATESTVYRIIRDEVARVGEKITEARLEKMVAVHANVINIKKALNEAKQIEAIAKGAVEAFKQRRDMLIQHGATEREERKGELRTIIRDDVEARKERMLRTLAKEES